MFYLDDVKENKIGIWNQTTFKTELLLCILYASVLREAHLMTSLPASPLVSVYWQNILLLHFDPFAHFSSSLVFLLLNRRICLRQDGLLKITAYKT